MEKFLYIVVIALIASLFPHPIVFVFVIVFY
jgi:hypothetical protein